MDYPEPENLLDKERMTDVLTELSIIEAAYQMKYIQVSRYSSVLLQDADSVFRVFNTDKDAFDASMDYYGHHQQELAEIYQAVKVNIEKRQAELPPISEEPVIQQDRDLNDGEDSSQGGDINPVNKIRTEEDMQNHY